MYIAEGGTRILPTSIDQEGCRMAAGLPYKSWQTHSRKRGFAYIRVLRRIKLFNSLPGIYSLQAAVLPLLVILLCIEAHASFSRSCVTLDNVAPVLAACKSHSECAVQSNLGCLTGMWFAAYRSYSPDKARVQERSLFSVVIRGNRATVRRRWAWPRLAPLGIAGSREISGI